MFRYSNLTVILVAGLAMMLVSAGESSAQCCATAVPTVAYQPATTAVAYQAYRPTTGWYPGYWLDRWRMRWGARSTVVAQPASYTSSYAAYAPAVQTVARPVSLTSYYGGATCATCCASPCACATQNVVMRPVTCCDPCTTCCASPCDACGCDPCSCAPATTSASPAVYESTGSSCPGCNATYTYPSTPQQSTGPSTFSTEQPSLGPSENPPASRNTLRPESNGNGQSVLETYESPSNEANGSSSYFEPPRLFSPRDRTTQRSIAPVRTAVYRQSVDESTPIRPTSLSMPVVDRYQAQRDAAAWSSAN